MIQQSTYFPSKEPSLYEILNKFFFHRSRKKVVKKNKYEKLQQQLFCRTHHV